MVVWLKNKIEFSLKLVVSLLDFLLIEYQWHADACEWEIIYRKIYDIVLKKKKRKKRK